MKFGVLGCAHGHIESFIRTMQRQGHTLMGIYDDVHDRAKAMADKYDVSAFETAKALLDVGIDAAGTSAVNDRKADLISACDERGVHVMADKPIVVNLEQYEQLEKIIKNGRIQVGMLLTLRYAAPFAALKSYCEAGVFGDFLSFEFANPHNLNPDSRDEWHFKDEQNGGPIVDLMIHCTDLLRWFAGECDIEKACGVKRKTVMPEKPTFFDYADVYIKAKQGYRAFFKTAWLMPSNAKASTYRVVVSGNRATAVIDQNELSVCQEGKPYQKVPFDKPDKDCTMDFLHGIQGKKRDITHEDILKATKMTLMMQEASDTVVTV